MPGHFCPFYNLECPESTACAIWTRFGCCVIEKPGIPAVYTKPNGEEMDVFILSIFQTHLPPPAAKLMVVYVCNKFGNICVEDGTDKFKIYLLHKENSRG